MPTKTEKIVVASPAPIGFGGALFLVFLVLKLTGVIAWSWLWVTAPLWVPVALVAGIALLFVVFGLIWTALYSLGK